MFGIKKSAEAEGGRFTQIVFLPGFLVTMKYCVITK